MMKIINQEHEELMCREKQANLKVTDLEKELSQEKVKNIKK